ncbi:MAG: CRISPR-associated endonuclease Cas2 [Acidobacteria bacterium]|jgi:CRISPR-associated protein Cas2|nr:CRISPR-associated endonuclease Cas2 [Bryobacteraceae bacterium CoA2 C42]
MARRSSYAGILQPRQLGAGSPEVSVLVLYDVENDRIRDKLADLCMNYGLVRIQFSAFLGKINRNRRQELSLRIRDLIGNQSARVRVIPIVEDAFKDMWILDQYRVDADKADERTEKAVPQNRLVLKIIPSEDR